MGENNWMGVIVICFFFFLFTYQTKNKYQVSSYGNSRAIVLDTETGEAWTTDTYSDIGVEVGESGKTVYLRSVGYMRQSEDPMYTPDDVRNFKNITWSKWIDRTLRSLFKDKLSC